MAIGRSSHFLIIIDTILSNNTGEYRNDVIHLFVRQQGMQRKRDFIAKGRIGIGEILNMKSHCPVCCQHRQRDIVNVAGNSLPRHFCKNGISLFLRDSGYSTYIQMSRRLMVWGIVRQGEDTQRGKGFVIATYNFSAAHQHFRISMKLRKTNRSSQIS